MGVQWHLAGDLERSCNYLADLPPTIRHRLALKIGKLDVELEPSRSVTALSAIADVRALSFDTRAPFLLTSIVEELAAGIRRSGAHAVHYVAVRGVENLLTAQDFAGVANVNLLGCSSLTDVTGLTRAEYVCMSRCPQLTDVSALRNVHVLHLMQCSSLTDVSALGHVAELSLSYCSVTDVSMLHGVRHIQLIHCNGVTDVSALGNARSLLLSDCNAIQDVTGLGGVHALNI